MGNLTPELAKIHEETRELPVRERRPVYGTWPRMETGMLEGDVVYLRLPRMTGDAAAALPRTIEAFGAIVEKAQAALA